MKEERYNKKYNYGNIEFSINDCIPTISQCRFLILKVLEQAIREYCLFANSKTQHKQNVWRLARDFLFDDSYRFMWGDLELSLEEFLNFVDIDIGFVRNQTRRKFEKENHNGKKK